ncbi:immunity 49 family protein [Streptomyces sp. NBC_00249]|uniref:immunity 49 family protein n=1 Tax=Streptomyces sp. NBC_00249 TaxID=2975690 RepID=UPI002259EAE5|nr:immunity 49 family protein [Streptomyces sp. NBC_00249]MCX5195908.1 immunity 49 family protein [Streptomyces sp. NBC_00249]
MTLNVSRQDYPTDSMAAVVPVMEQSLSDSLETIETSHDARADAIWDSLNVVRVRCVGDPHALMPETRESWLLAMQVHSAVFAAAATGQETVTCEIRQEERRLATTGPQVHLHAGNWVNAFYLALICRETARLDMLARIPVSLLRDFGGAFDEYLYAWVETLQSFWLHRDDLREHLVRAVDLSTPGKARVLDRAEVSMLRRPPIMMLYRYLRNDPAGFDEALADAVHRHKQYWTATEDRTVNITGVVAIAPLALACLAKANGFPMETRSAYLPEALLDFARHNKPDA